MIKFVGVSAKTYCYLIDDILKKTHKELTKNNKLILKTQQIFKSERHNVFTQ